MKHQSRPANGKYKRKGLKKAGLLLFSAAFLPYSFQKEPGDARRDDAILLKAHCCSYRITPKTEDSLTARTRIEVIPCPIGLPEGMSKRLSERMSEGLSEKLSKYLSRIKERKCSASASPDTEQDGMHGSAEKSPHRRENVPNKKREVTT